MSLLPYALPRALLFRMDAETAHERSIDALAALQHTPLRCGFAQTFVEDPVSLCGLRLPNRVGLAAGMDKNARCVAAWQAMGFGFIEVGTVTPRAQSGNPKPRLFRLPQSQALINRMGFNNDGLDALLRRVQHGKAARGRCLLGINVGKNADTPMQRATEDYLLGLQGAYPWADYVAINISSPNTQNLRSLQGHEALDALLAALLQRRAELAQQHGADKPLFVKIAPDLEDAHIAAMAAALRRHGCRADGSHGGVLGLIATNTTLDREAVQGQAHAHEAGGLSGAPLREMSNRVIAQLRAALGADFPIIGAGGIFSGADAQAKIAAGADAVQLLTGLVYRGPELVSEVAQALRA